MKFEFNWCQRFQSKRCFKINVDGWTKDATAIGILLAHT